MTKKRPSGDGMIRKRSDGRWEGRIVIGYKVNGNPMFRSVYADTQKALLAKLHHTIDSHQNVKLSEESRMTLRQWFEVWLNDYMLNSIRPSTLAGYRRMAEDYINPILGDKPVYLITQMDIQKMYAKLKKHGRKHEHPEHGHELSNTMVNSIHCMLHLALKYAVQAHIIPSNPTEGAVAPRPNKSEKHILDNEQLDCFMEKFERIHIGLTSSTLRSQLECVWVRYAVCVGRTSIRKRAFSKSGEHFIGILKVSRQSVIQRPLPAEGRFTYPAVL